MLKKILSAAVIFALLLTMMTRLTETNRPCRKSSFLVPIVTLVDADTTAQACAERNVPKAATEY